MTEARRRRLPWAAAFVVFLLGLLVRVPLMTGRHEIVPGGDSGDYVRLAEAIASGGELGAPYRLPGYPALLALLDVLPWRVEDSVVVLQHALGALLAGALVLLVWRWFNAPAALMAGLLAALTPGLPHLEHAVLTDFFFALAILAAAVLIGRSLAHGPPSVRVLVAVGALLAASAYLRGSGQFAFVAPVVAVAFVTRDLRQTARAAGVLALTGAVLMAPWIIRNAVQYDSASMTLVGGDTLFVRAFEEDRLKIPTDTPLGAFVSDAAASRGDERMVTAVTLSLQAQGVSRLGTLEAQQDLASTAIRRNPMEYIGGTLREVSELRLDPRDATIGSDVGPHIPDPPALSQRVWDAMDGLSGLWWLASLGTFAGLAVLFLPDRRARLMGVSLLAMWLAVAGGTALSRGSLERYALELAPISFVLGSVGIVAIATALVRTTAALVRRIRHSSAASRGSHAV